MARFIRVNHRQLESAASIIEANMSTRKSLISQATSQVVGMKGAWDGMDYSAYLSRWNGMIAPTAQFAQSDKALKSYVDFLRYASGQYKNAQATAINKANLIPIW